MFSGRNVKKNSSLSQKVKNSKNHKYVKQYKYFLTCNSLRVKNVLAVIMF